MGAVIDGWIEVTEEIVAAIQSGPLAASSDEVVPVIVTPKKGAAMSHEPVFCNHRYGDIERGYHIPFKNLAPRRVKKPIKLGRIWRVQATTTCRARKLPAEVESVQ